MTKDAGPPAPTGPAAPPGRSAPPGVSAIPTLTAERLLLRPFLETDEDAALEFHSREDVTRYIPWPVRNRQQVREAIAKYIAGQSLTADGDWMNFAVVETATGLMIGQVLLGLHSVEHRGGELGYAFNPSVSGRGVATEACAEMLRWGFTEVGLHRIVARIDARNTASERVAVRLGMRREAHLRENEFFKGEWTDELDYALLASEWAQAAPGRAPNG